MSMTLGASQVTIRYGSEITVEAVVLFRQGDILRVAPRYGDDALVFRCLNGAWISEECEPVQIDFAWRRRFVQPPVCESDCICSHALAASLIRLLLNGGEQNEDETGIPMAGRPEFESHATAC
jgi:hypothetical protein